MLSLPAKGETAERTSALLTYCCPCWVPGLAGGAPGLAGGILVERTGTRDSCSSPGMGVSYIAGSHRLKDGWARAEVGWQAASTRSEEESSVKASLLLLVNVNSHNEANGGHPKGPFSTEEERANTNLLGRESRKETGNRKKAMQTNHHTKKVGDRSSCTVDARIISALRSPGGGWEAPVFEGKPFLLA